MDWSSVKVSMKVKNGKKRMIRMKDNHFFSIHVCVIGLSLKITIFGVWGKNIDIWFDLGI